MFYNIRGINHEHIICPSPARVTIKLRMRCLSRDHREELSYIFFYSNTNDFNSFTQG